MPIIAVGITHREAPVELRERLAIPSHQLEQAIERLRAYVQEGVIVSTCNRTEVFATVGHRASGVRTLTRFLAETSGLSEDDLGGHLRSHWQEHAIRHLFRVAAGLDSMIIGEGQILAQVRQAYDLCSRDQSVGPVLSRLFEQALLVGKRARSETAIARNAVSVSQAAVELARGVVGSLKQSTVVLIGAGKMGGLAAKALCERGVARVIVVNRGSDRATTLVEQLGGEAWPLARLDQALGLADIVISSTAADDYVVRSSRLGTVMAGRSGRPMVVVDIAVPRDVEPNAAEIPDVHLYNVDDLSGLCAANLDGRRREEEKIEAIIEEELTRFVAWWEAREVAPTIAALVQKAEAIRRDELTRMIGRLGELSERDVNTLNALTNAIVKKMLHGPITRLKESGHGMDGRHYLHAVRELFDLPAPELAAE